MRTINVDVDIDTYVNIPVNDIKDDLCEIAENDEDVQPDELEVFKDVLDKIRLEEVTASISTDEYVDIDLDQYGLIEKDSFFNSAVEARDMIENSDLLAKLKRYNDGIVSEFTKEDLKGLENLLEQVKWRLN